MKIFTTNARYFQLSSVDIGKHRSRKRKRNPTKRDCFQYQSCDQLRADDQSVHRSKSRILTSFWTTIFLVCDLALTTFQKAKKWICQHCCLISSDIFLQTSIGFLLGCCSCEQSIVSEDEIADSKRKIKSFQAMIFNSFPTSLACRFGTIGLQPFMEILVELAQSLYHSHRETLPSN